MSNIPFVHTGKFGILTAGGDCPGLNAAIQALCCAASTRFNMKMVGIFGGYQGLISGNARELNPRDYEDILTQGGTILGSSRVKPYKNEDDSYDTEMSKVELIKENYRKLGLDCLVVLGGNGTHSTAYRLSWEGLNILGLPKTIDNDIVGTDYSFGFDTAVSVASDAVYRHHSTAQSHSRVMVIELMGHKAGWLALYAGIAGGADVILLPEIPYDLDSISRHIKERTRRGKNYSIVVVAEGALSVEEEQMSKKERKKFRSETVVSSISHRIANEIEIETSMESRATVLGYIQRGGMPSPADRILATSMGTAAAGHLAKGEYGRMMAIVGNEITSVDLSVPADKVKTVPLDHYMVKSALSMGICLGDDL